MLDSPRRKFTQPISCLKRWWRTGAATGALGIAQDAGLLGSKHGVVLDTFWTWGRPLRFYLNQGFWLMQGRDGLRLIREKPGVVAETEGTFALNLAARGWPLIRSEEQLAASRQEFDVGGPEALSRRIELFEALAREEGLVVDAPRIPGLSDRSVAEIRRAWKEERGEESD